MAALGVAPRQVGAAAPAATVLDTRIISPPGYHYCGWPTVARRKNGQLLLVCSGGRVAHVCPFGRVELLTSDDNGETWTWPRVLLDSAIDDRDAGVLETAAVRCWSPRSPRWRTSRAWLAPNRSPPAKMVPGMKPGSKAGRQPATAFRPSSAKRSWAPGCCVPPMGV